MIETRSRPVSKTLLIVISLVVIAVVALIVTGIHLSNPYLRRRVVEMLGEKFHADVELKEFHVYLFPGVRIEGSGLALRHEGRTDVPPLISIQRVLGRGRHSGTALEAVENRTRSSSRDWSYRFLPRKTGGNRIGQRRGTFPCLIGEIVSDDAELRMLPKSADKDPHIFAIHHLVMHSVGLDRPAQFTAQLTNAVPPGEIETKGSFGPWSPDDPGPDAAGGRVHVRQS